MKLRLALALCLPLGQACLGSVVDKRRTDGGDNKEPHAAAVRSCKSKGELCATSADCCRGLGLICLQLPVAVQTGDAEAEEEGHNVSDDALLLRTSAIRSVLIPSGFGLQV
jgi:hypothetical protein